MKKKDELKSIIRKFSSEGNYVSAIPVMEEYVELIKETYGATSDRYVTVINDLGGMYRNIGDFDNSNKTFQEALDIIENKLGNRCEQYATTTVNRACMFRLTGEFQRAEEAFLNAISIYDENEEMQNILYSETCSSLGKEIAEKEEVEKIKNKKRTLYANACNNLGTLYQDMKKYDTAIIYHTKSLELLKHTNNYEYIAITLNNFVNPLLQKKNFEEALRIVNESLELFVKHLSNKHPFYSTALNNKGAIYYYIGEIKKALECFSEVEKILKETYGEKSPQYISCVKNIKEVEKLIKE